MPNNMFSESRFKIQPTGPKSWKIDRISHPYIDQAICTCSEYLKGKRITSKFQMAQYSHDALSYYIEIPIVTYFFSLPHLRNMRNKNKPLIYSTIHRDLYRGVEALFMDIYANIATGESVSDKDIINTIKNM
ncbi:unnamed protein product [marine sediment metagenome]|uniref:Uncharacterized protein n=1 Tax=marine sediment metagenome TaxID=412755 RepID=X1FC43_9ZZZZ